MATKQRRVKVKPGLQVDRKSYLKLAPCKRCVRLYLSNRMGADGIRPMPVLRKEWKKLNGEAVCNDCHAAHVVQTSILMLKSWEDARARVAGWRVKSLSYPMQHMGLVQIGLMETALPGELSVYPEWLASVLANLKKDAEDERQRRERNRTQVSQGPKRTGRREGGTVTKGEQHGAEE